MRSTLRRTMLGWAIALAASGTISAEAHAAPVWSLDPAVPPAGAPFGGPVGAPGDLKFLSPSFGLMIVKNTPGSTFASGLMGYDGTRWRQIATVCGGAARSARIALVSEREWWTLSDPAPGLDGVVSAENPTVTLCHFVDGRVVASYATAPADQEAPYPTMNAAACNGPNDCWFSGPVVDIPQFGTFYLHWDGVQLTATRHPSARGVADLQAFGGAVIGGTAVGTGFDQSAASLVTGEDIDPVDIVGEPNGPRLLRTLGPGGIGVLDWPRRTGPDRIDVAAMDGDGQQLWIAGLTSQTALVPDAEPQADDPVPAPPYLARQTLADPLPQPVELDTTGPADLELGDFIGDIAAVPGRAQAWVTVKKRAGAIDAVAAVATVALVDASGSVLERVSLGRDDVAVGEAAKIACPAADQCWMVTANGWIYRLAEPSAEPTAPLVSPVITVRPPDPRTPRTPPDTVPQDESSRFVAPTIEAPAPEVIAPTPKPIAALLRVVGKVRTEKRRFIVMRIQVRRRARVQLVGTRGQRTVARTKARTFKPGRYTLRMRANPKRWPTSLKFVTKDFDLPDVAPSEDDTGAGSGDTVTT